jgi:iron(III) transport system permease protein
VSTSPFAFATAVITLFGRSGMISRDILGLSPTLYGLPGLTIVLTSSFFPVAYMSILGMMKNLDPALDEASSSLGASKVKTFFKVTLPMLIEGFASSFLLLFVEATADLANPLVIGGDFTVLSSRAYIAINGEYDVPAGAAYSMILLVPGLIVFIVQRYWGERKSVVTVTGKPTGTPTFVENKVAKFLLLIIPVLMASFIVLIYTTVIYGSFAKFLGVDNSLTLDNYRYIFSGVGYDAIIKTTMMAIIATPIAGLLGLVLAWLIVRKVKKGRKLLDFFGMLGLAVPGTVLGIGFAITFNHSTKIGDTTILPQLAGGGAIFGGAIAIIMVYTIRSSPAGQRSGIAALQQINPAIDEASASLGASGFTTFRKVTLPMALPV